MAEKKKKPSIVDMIGAQVGDVSIAAMDAGAKAVSDPDSKREQIVYLPRTSLVGDENNFYSMEGIEELAANIETVGLLDPIRVRRIEGEEDLFRVVSGHRRRAALDKLALDGHDLGDVPCIVEKSDGVSPALAELRLIFANSDTRRMSSADISKQAERVEALLYQLKEEGFEFPGRMRDHVAEACKTSATKLANLKVIREKLIPELQQLWEAGELNDSKAIRFAQEPEAVQVRATEILTAPQIAEFTESAIDRLCRQAEGDVQRRAGVKSTPKPDATPKSDGLSDYLQMRADENMLLDEAVRIKLLNEFSKSLTTCETRKDGIDVLKEEYGRYHHSSYGGSVNYDASPKGLEFSLPYKNKIFRTWTEVWDALAVVALRERGAIKAKVNTSAAAPAADAAPTWRTDEPPKDADGFYYCKDAEGFGHVFYRYFDVWFEDHYCKHKVDEELWPVAWYPLPKEKRSDL